MYSSIKRKKCKCSDSCTMMPTTSFSGFYYKHAPQEVKDRQGLKAKQGYQNNRVRQNKAVLASKLHKAANGTKIKFNGQELNVMSSKTVLLGIADKIFGDWVKNRDKFKYFDEVQEKEVEGIKCPCCGQTFCLDAKDENGETIVHAMHFVNRSVYSLRFDERNVWGGCCFCNSKQHQNPKGKQYQKFKDFLVLKLGIGIVWQMESARRNINKLTDGDLRDIIEKYKPKK